MAYSKAMGQSQMKYMKEKRDRININLPKGKKEIYQAYAKSKGKSLTQYWVDCIESDIEKDKQNAN